MIRVTPEQLADRQRKKELQAKQFTLRLATIGLGIATVEEAATKAAIPAKEVLQLWAQTPGFQWIDEGSGYGWQQAAASKPDENYLVRCIQKIVCVSPRCSFDEMMIGLNKTRLFKGRNIPAGIIKTFLSQAGFTIQADMISSQQALDPVRVLPKVEYEFYTILKQGDGMAHHNAIARHFETVGIREETYAPTMTRTPIMLKVERHIWRQVGIPGTPEQVAQLKQGEPVKGPRDVSGRATRIGDELMILMPITESARKRGRGHIPQAAQGLIAGNYTLVFDGEPIGRLNVTGPIVIDLQKAHRLFATAEYLVVGFEVGQSRARLLPAAEAQTLNFNDDFL
jgi:hypothetical protein